MGGLRERPKVPPRRILAGLAFLAALAATMPTLADYLGPNRTVTTWVWRRLHCHYQAIYDPPGPGWWSCYLNLYYPPNASCPKDVAAYFTPSDCNWPEAFCQTRGCAISRTSSIVSCGEGESGCRAMPQTVTHPEATVSGSVTCSTPGSAGWCRGGAALSLSGSEPLTDHRITMLEGTRNGKTFACPGASCSVPLVEGTNDFTFWALSSWGDSSRMGTASGRLDSSPPTISGQMSGAAGENGWYVSEVTVTAGAADLVSGLAAFEVSLNGGGWRPYSGAITFSDGEHRLDLRAFDVAGNAASESLSVRVDTLAPEVTLSAGGAFCPGCGQRLEVTLSVADGGSGVGEWSLNVGGVPLREGTGPAGETFIWDGSGLAAGTHTLSLEAWDNAGNAAETTLNIWLIAPTPVPATPTSPPQGGPGSGGGAASGPLNPSGGASPTQAPGRSATPISTRTPNPTRTPSTSSFGGVPVGQQGGAPGMAVGGGAGSVGGAWPGSSSAGDAAAAASTTSSGVLWGAAAAVVIAAATAAALEAARKRQEEEERARAEMERRNAEAEAKEAEQRHLAWLAALAAAAAAAAAAAKETKDHLSGNRDLRHEEQMAAREERRLDPRPLPQAGTSGTSPPFDLAKWKQQDYAELEAWEKKQAEARAEENRRWWVSNPPRVPQTRSSPTESFADKLGQELQAEAAELVGDRDLSKLLQRVRRLPVWEIPLPWLQGFGIDDVAGPLLMRVDTAYLVRAIGRAVGDPLLGPVGLAAGYGLTIAPELLANVEAKAPPEEFVADLVVDSVGFLVSEGFGWLAAGAAGGTGPGALVAKVVVDVGVGVAYDRLIDRLGAREWLAEQLRPTGPHEPGHPNYPRR